MIQEKEYAKRRHKLLKKLKPDSVAVICSAEAKVRSNDTHYPYRQNSNFYYLSGFKEENAALVFVKRKKKGKVFLFVQEKNPQKELWEGKVLGIKAAKKRFDVDGVYAIGKLEEKLKEFLRTKERLYFEFSHKTKCSAMLDALSSNLHTKKNLSKTVEKMRLVKSKSEIALIKKGLAITKKAHHNAMKKKKAGMMEYELQADFEYIFKKHGAYSDAYTTIVAGGDNANTLHYIKNDKKLKSGELVLIDAGCEYDYYATDITRTIPISGKFTKSQKEVYELVLRVQKKILKTIRPGVLRSDLQKKTQKLLTKGLVELGIFKGSVKKLLKNGKIKRYYPHGIGHFMGLDVHDQNPYKTKKGKEIALQAGMVLTVEPGLYLPKKDKKIPKKYRGIGVRIEDDVVVTKNGSINLSWSIAKEVEEIEALYSS